MIRAVIFDMYETLITHYESPLYFGTEIARDAGVERERFLRTWRAAEEERTTGKMTLEEILEKILRENDCYREETVRMLAEKRIRLQKEVFRHLHAEILPMLRALRERNLRIGLVSNCFSEEAAIIRESVLFPYFDAVCLSYEEGVQKPDPAIFLRCLEKLRVRADESLYVGDGGSGELEAASAVGMKAVQAVWYLKEHTAQPAKRKEAFVGVETPLGLLEFLA